MARPAIPILENGHLNNDFLNGCAIQNARAVLKVIASDRGIKGRSIDDLLGQVGDGGLPTTPAEFREAIWGLMEAGYKGNLHISLIALGPLLQSEPEEKILEAHRRWQAVSRIRQDIHTREVLDSRLDAGAKSVEMLYVGQAEADIFDENESYNEEVNGKEYYYKAYRVVDVPVFSKVTVGLEAPYIIITTRAVHQKVRPISEIEGVRDVLHRDLQVEVPPLGGVGPGVRALWGSSILPRKYEVHEADGSKVNFTCAPSQKNPSSENIEQELLTWEFKHGALMFQDQTVGAPFLVDAGRAAFSFGAKVTPEQASHVISEILAAAP